jgi:hypothetical protein
LKSLNWDFEEKLLARRGKGGMREHMGLKMWQGLKPSFFGAFSARLKSYPVTKLASTAFLRQVESFPADESSGAIALTEL